MAAENTAFAPSGEDAITRTIDVQVDTTADRLTPAEFDNFYEIERTSEEIIKGDFKRVWMIQSCFQGHHITVLPDRPPISRRIAPRFCTHLQKAKI